jgi:ComF family protein
MTISFPVLKRGLKRLSTYVLDFLFPIQCVGCGKDDEWLCGACSQTIPRVQQLACFSCGRPSIDGRFCDSCPRERALKGIWVASVYHAPVLREGIKYLKYHGVSSLVPPLSRFLSDFSSHWPFLFSKRIMYVPVPLYKKRERERGFNQAHLLVATYLLEREGGVCGCWLVARARKTKPQVKLKRSVRLNNVRDAFRYRGPGTGVFPNRVVLVDDVATTGATLEECARPFSEAGAKDLWALVLAKA